MTETALYPEAPVYISDSKILPSLQDWPECEVIIMILLIKIWFYNIYNSIWKASSNMFSKIKELGMG